MVWKHWSIDIKKKTPLLTPAKSTRHSTNYTSDICELHQYDILRTPTLPKHELRH